MLSLISSRLKCEASPGKLGPYWPAEHYRGIDGNNLMSGGGPLKIQRQGQLVTLQRVFLGLQYK